MPRIFLLIISLGIFVFVAGTTPAAASEIKVCGVPVAGDLHMSNTSNVDYCDLHARRLGYGAQQKKFSERIAERQKDFISPRLKAVDRYKGGLEEIYYPEEKKTGKKEEQTEQTSAEGLPSDKAQILVK